MTFVVEGIGLYFLIINTIRSVDTLRWVVWVLLAVGTFLGVLSFYQDATKTYDNNYGGFAQMSDALIDSGSGVTGADLQPRLAGPIGEKNRYAQIMLMLVPLGLFWAISARRRLPKILAIARRGCRVPGGGADVLAGSRGRLRARAADHDRARLHPADPGLPRRAWPWRS